MGRVRVLLLWSLLALGQLAKPEACGVCSSGGEKLVPSNFTFPSPQSYNGSSFSIPDVCTTVNGLTTCPGSAVELLNCSEGVRLDPSHVLTWNTADITINLDVSPPAKISGLVLSFRSLNAGAFQLSSSIIISAVAKGIVMLSEVLGMGDSIDGVYHLTISRRNENVSRVIIYIQNSGLEWLALDGITVCVQDSMPQPSPTDTPTTSLTPTASPAGSSDDSSTSTLAIGLLIGVVAVAFFLFLIVLLLSIILCIVCRQSHSEQFSIENASYNDSKTATYDMLRSMNGTLPADKKSVDYDYPDLDIPPPRATSTEDFYTAPGSVKPETRKSPDRCQPYTLPAKVYDLETLLYEKPTTTSKATFSKVIENGEPVYYMLDKRCSFYDGGKSKSLSAVDLPSSSSFANLHPYVPIYDDPQPLQRSEAPRSVKSSDVTEMKLLGYGQFGEVYLAQVVGVPNTTFGEMNLSPGGPMLVAIKKLKSDSSDSTKQAFEKEIKFMSRLKHKHVIRLLGICTTDTPFIMIEYARYGDLNQYLRKLKLIDGSFASSKAEITKLSLLSQCTQIAAGMEYLSSLNFIHRDLASRNILVGDWNQLKIADFGMSQNLYDSDYYRVTGHAIVPVRWMPTESFFGRFSVKSDVWAFGVVVWEIFVMCTQRPYEQMTDAELIQDARNGPTRRLLTQPPNCPDSVYQLVLQCWKHLPAERASFAQLHGQFERLCNNSTSV